jgi:lactam utilization protein B
MIALFAIGLDLGVKQHALIDKPLDAWSGVAGDEGDRMAIAEARAGDQRIFDMGFNTVRLIENGGNPALRVERRTFADRPFTQHGHRTVLRQAQRKGRPAAPLPIINTSQEKSGVVFIVFV